MENPYGHAPPAHPAPAVPPAPPPDPPELPEGADPRPRWPWWYGVVAFVAALVGTFLVGAVVIGIASAAGMTSTSTGSPARMRRNASWLASSIFCKA